MTTVAEVKLWGRSIGAVSWDARRRVAAFEYDSKFTKSGIELSPISMPLSNRVYEFPELPWRTFHGLPGLLADTLPDKFGNALIDAWLATQGRTPESFNPVERLCYTGKRGMGALEFVPSIGPKQRKSQSIAVDELVELASKILSQRVALRTSFAKSQQEVAMREILSVGTSAGGARAKAVIAWNRKTNEVKSGQVNAGEGFTYWLLKFDGVRSNKDKELDDSVGYGAIEYAYSLMAREAGIEMSECRLLEENGRRHFVTKRFDRYDDGGKLHMHSLCGLAHFDFNEPGAYSYEQAMLIIRALNLPQSSVEEQFRRMTFNIIARNQDDHVKNIAFLMDQKGKWTLSPAYDISYSYNPNGSFTATHQMSMNGKRDGFLLSDFRECGKNVRLIRGRAEAIVDEVLAAVKQWPRFAKQAQVEATKRDKIQKTLRLKVPLR